MARLKNERHEKFAQALIEKEGNQSHAYAEAFPSASKATLGVNSSRLANSLEIKNRVREIAEAKGFTVEWLMDRMKFFAKKSDAVGLDATKFGFKIHGFLDGEREKEDGSNNIEINVNIGVVNA